jgi:hypothetical protein
MIFNLTVKNSEKISSLLESILTITVIIRVEKYNEKRISSKTTVRKEKNDNAKSSPVMINEFMSAYFLTNCSVTFSIFNPNLKFS